MRGLLSERQSHISTTKPTTSYDREADRGKSESKRLIDFEPCCRPLPRNNSPQGQALSMLIMPTISLLSHYATTPPPPVISPPVDWTSFIQVPRLKLTPHTVPGLWRFAMLPRRRREFIRGKLAAVKIALFVSAQCPFLLTRIHRIQTSAGA